MKRILLFLALLASTLASYAQEISVTSMELLPMDLTARVYARKDLNGETCALIKVYLPVEGASFEGNVVGDTELNVNEYYVYMTSGSKVLVVRHPKYPTLTVNFGDYGVNAVETRSTYSLKLHADQLQEKIVVIDTVSVQTPVVVIDPDTDYEVITKDDGQVVYQAIKKPSILEKPLSFYIEGKFQALSTMGVGAAFGAFIKNFNVEANMLIGMSESEEVFFLPKDVYQKPYSYTYKSTGFGLKIGYAVPIGRSFRITPQVGAGVSSIKGSQSQAGTGSNPDATNAFAVPMSVGGRFDYLITNNFGLSVSPDMSFAIMKSDLYTRLSEVSSDVKAFGQGFNVRVGLFVCF